MFHRQKLWFCIPVAFVVAASAAAQEKPVCDAKEKRAYHRDQGVVCWDGETYHLDDDRGIPRYMMEYFDQHRRDSEQKPEKPVAGAKAQATGAVTAPRAAASPIPVPRTRAVRIIPVRPDIFRAVAAGTARSEVLARLGNPHRSISIPGDEGLVEIWTYSLTDGSRGKLTIRSGVVTSQELQK